MSATTPKTEQRPRATFPSPDWWVRDRHGKIAVAQPPNTAISVWIASVVIGWFGILDDHRSAILDRIGQGALIVWALDELVRGASPFRRVLGLVVLGAMLVRVFG